VAHEGRKDPPYMNTTYSVSVSIRPNDSQCRYWAKIVRAGTPLPMPLQVNGARDIPGHYLRNGEDELLEGDMLFEGEANHRRKQLGWTYRLTACVEGGRYTVWNPGAEIKVKMKAGGMPVELLPGSGEVAAMVRVAHAIRLGIPIREGEAV